ncbi:hypothetical protein [Hymenobacter sp. YC55]|uniref:hypothetical protein n=1 Tax=Hymenobacter sp. YC55 TaxID=3034019 RepID=UPI0023F9FB31|nr:hypothetical protein [Hymenobacter sp. YC55]MDF7812583.1 hypothetical protein [Hymenobacter sp. YC55]
MTENYLQSLGFEPFARAEGGSRATAAHSTAWRYRHAHAAQDGTHLYAEHPLGVARCRLSTLPAPLDQHDVLLDTGLDDRAALETAISGFFTTHGGIGTLIAPASANAYRPYRRQE